MYLIVVVKIVYIFGYAASSALVQLTIFGQYQYFITSYSTQNLNFANRLLENGVMAHGNSSFYTVRIFTIRNDILKGSFGFFPRIQFCLRLMLP